MRAPSLSVVIAAAFLIGTPALFLARPERPPEGTAPPRAAARPAAVAPGLTAPLVASPAQSPPAVGWEIPDPDALPDDTFGRAVRHGRDLIAKTSSLIGPDAADPAMRYAGNGLDCQSCHLQAGTQQYGLSLAGIWGVFPTYIGRENEVRTLEERVNGCMERSMNGRALPVEGPEMKAILT